MHSRQKLWSQPSGEPTACDVSRARHIGQRGQASSTSPSLSDSNSSLKATVPLPSVFTSHELLASVSLAVSDPINTQSKCIRIINSMHSERILTRWNTLWLLFSFFLLLFPTTNTSRVAGGSTMFSVCPLVSIHSLCLLPNLWTCFESEWTDLDTNWHKRSTVPSWHVMINFSTGDQKQMAFETQQRHHSGPS